MFTIFLMTMVKQKARNRICGHQVPVGDECSYSIVHGDECLSEVYVNAGLSAIKIFRTWACWFNIATCKHDKDVQSSLSSSRLCAGTLQSNESTSLSQTVMILYICGKDLLNVTFIILLL